MDWKKKMTTLQTERRRASAIPRFPNRSAAGFTLIELMIVIAIISILATMSIPRYHGMVVSAQLKEALVLADQLKPALAEVYRKTGTFPADNASAGLPAPDKLIGNYVKRIRVGEGALYIELGNKVHATAEGKVLTVRPIVVEGSPESPFSWICGNASVPEGMLAVGEDKTDVPDALLPIQCRI